MIDPLSAQRVMKRHAECRPAPLCVGGVHFPGGGKGGGKGGGSNAGSGANGGGSGGSTGGPEGGGGKNGNGDGGGGNSGGGSSGGTGTGDTSARGGGTVSPLETIGIDNALCHGSALKQLSKRGRENCLRTGTPEGTFPASNYGLDVHIDTGITAIVDNFRHLVAQLASTIWMFMVFVFRLVFIFLGWALELNPFGGGAMAKIALGLERFYRAFTSPWMGFAVVALGGWILWRGIVQRRAGETVGGALIAVLFMLVGLWVIHEPRESVGRVAGFSNDLALTLIAAPQEGSLSKPVRSYGEATGAVWRGLVDPLFAVLNFSDPKFADREVDPDALRAANEEVCKDPTLWDAVTRRQLAEAATKYDEFLTDSAECQKFANTILPVPKTNLELYLRSSPESASREALWEEFERDGPDPVEIQGTKGAWIRFPLAAIMALGLLGGVLLLGWIGFRLLIQASVAFVLTLIAPIAFFFPALGETGRNAFRLWGMTLLGSLLAKAIYAAVLGVVVFGVGVITSAAGQINYVLAALLATMFVWAIFLKRDELMSWLSPGEHEGGAPRGLGQLYYGMQLGRASVGKVAAAAGIGAAAGTLAGRAVGGGRTGRMSGAEAMARGEGDQKAAEYGDRRYEEKKQAVAEHDGRRRELAEVRTERQQAEQAVEAREARTPPEARRAAERASELRTRAEELRRDVKVGRGGSAAERDLAQVTSERLAAEQAARAGGVAVGAGAMVASQHVEALRRREKTLGRQVEAGEEQAGHDRQFVRRADMRAEETGSRWGSRELRGFRNEIRQENNLPVEDPAHARLVGMSKEDYRRAVGDPEQWERLRPKVEKEREHQRKLVDAISDDPDRRAAPKPEALRTYNRSVRQRVREARAERAERATHGKRVRSSGRRREETGRRRRRLPARMVQRRPTRREPQRPPEPRER